MNAPTDFNRSTERQSNKLNPQLVETYLLDGQSHTLRSVCQHFEATDTQERQIDKIIQKLRKANKIAKSRSGQFILWTATPSAAS